MGRLTRCAPALTKAIVKLLEEGISFKTACAAQGLADRIGYEWMLKGEEGLDPYADFSSQVTRAGARGTINLHRQARSGEKGSSQALEILKRRFHAEYGDVTKLEHSGPGGKPIETDATVTIDYGQLSDDELRRLAAGGQPADPK